MNAAGLAYSLAVSLGLTLIIECSFALLTGKRGRDLLLVLLVNVMTNPAAVTVVLLIKYAYSLPKWAVMIPVEAAVIAVEAYIYNKFGSKYKHPVLFSISANAISVAVGILLEIML